MTVQQQSPPETDRERQREKMSMAVSKQDSTLKEKEELEQRKNVSQIDL